MKIGDLVWYNCAGSKQTGLVLGFAKNTWLDHTRKTDMVKIYWISGAGPRPAMYSGEGQRLYNSDITRKPECFECYVRVKSRSGFDLFKVISEA
jgi:hypothetical protein